MSSLFRLVPLLLLLSSVHNLVSAKKGKGAINFTSHDIDDIVSLINSKVNIYVDHIYHIEFDIKATKDTNRA
jgi:hypothetical protein